MDYCCISSVRASPVDISTICPRKTHRFLFRYIDQILVSIILNGANSIQIINANTIVYAIAFFFTKLSILLQFQRIFVTVRRSIADITIKCLIWFHALLYLALLLVCVFQCVPRSKIWNKKTPGTCINVDAAYIMYGVVNVFSDFLILLWPVPFIRRLQVPLRKKIALCLVFSAGFL